MDGHNDKHQPVGAVDIPCSPGPSPTRLHVMVMPSIVVPTIDMFPVFDVLERLYESGHRTSKQDGRWWLWDAKGEGVESGITFRELCVNVLLAGL